MRRQTIVNFMGCYALLVAGCGGAGSDALDIGIGADASAAADATVYANACKRVDLVFSIDASSTMRDEIAALSTTVFPLFADRLRAVGNGLEDYRVGVIDACPAPATLHARGMTTEDCGFTSGQVWMDSSSANLNEEFACVADMYTGDYGPDIAETCTQQNDDEQPANAAATALLPPYSTSENAGFLRDDALLVIVAITDEDENAIPPGGDSADRISPEEIYQKLVSIKGDVGKMVFLGIGGLTACADGEYGEAKQAARLKAITDQFVAEERGVFWDLCTGKLEDGLEQAMIVIEETCKVL